MDALASEEYASQSKLLQEFTNAPSIDGAWVFQTNNGRDDFRLYLISNHHFTIFQKWRKATLVSCLQKTDPQQCIRLAKQTYWQTTRENIFCFLIL